MSMFNKLKEIKDMRSQAKQLKNQLSQETVNVSARGINLVMDGNQEVAGLDISPDMLKPEKKEDLEKALKEAFNDAIKKVQRIIAQKVQSGDFKMPNINRQ